MAAKTRLAIDLGVTGWLDLRAQPSITSEALAELAIVFAR